MNLKKENGITMIALIITIIILSILSSVAIISTKNAVDSSKFYAIVNEIRVMQEYVNSIYQENKTSGIYDEMGEDITEFDSKIITETLDKSLENKESYAKYRYWTADYIKSLGIDGITKDFLVNLSIRDVILVGGVTYEGTTYYRLKDIPSGMWNVDKDIIISSIDIYSNDTYNNGISVGQTIDFEARVIFNNIELNDCKIDWTISDKNIASISSRRKTNWYFRR